MNKSLSYIFLFPNWKLLPDYKWLTGNNLISKIKRNLNWIRTILNSMEGGGMHSFWNVESFQDELCCWGNIQWVLIFHCKFNLMKALLGYKPKWLSNKNKGKGNGLNRPCQIIILLLEINLHKCELDWPPLKNKSICNMNNKIIKITF